MRVTPSFGAAPALAQCTLKTLGSWPGNLLLYLSNLSINTWIYQSHTTKEIFQTNTTHVDFQSTHPRSNSRLPNAPGVILQKAYAVLDKYKISKTFFVKSDQNDCAQIQPSAEIPANVPENEEEPAASKSALPEEASLDVPQAVPQVAPPAQLESQQVTKSAETQKIASVPELVLKKASLSKASEAVPEKIDDKISSSGQKANDG